MDEYLFWHIIDLFDWRHEGDDTKVMRRAIDALGKLSLQDINQFEEILADKLFALDCEVYARNIGEYSYGDSGKYFSVDYFLYVRCCVVVNGKDFYYNVLNNPSKMPKDKDFESLLYLTSKAAAQKGYEEYSYLNEVSYETFSNLEGWQYVT